MIDIKHAIEIIETHIPDPKQGLGEVAFRMVSRLTPLVNVDLLFQNDSSETLLTWRADEFYGPGWHIPGGILRFKETFATRIHAVSRLELNASVEHDDEAYLIKQCINPTRDTRGHFISHLFRCRLTSPLDVSKKFDAHLPQNGQWAWHRSMPENFLEVQKEIYSSIFSN
jgi:colanic acid biosynthesis protein WcaH